MRYLKTENDYLQYLEEIDGKIINSASFPFGSVYFRVSNGTKLTFFLGSSNEPYKKEIFNLDFPISFNGEFYQNYADAEEVLGELFGSPSKELKDKVAEIEDNLNTALTNLENNTEDIEVLQDQMEQKADLSEVYTQERVDLLLNLKVDNSTLQNQYYDKNATDAKLALKSDKADTYNKTDVNNLLVTKASKDEVDLLKTEVDSINDDLLLKANKADVYEKTQTDNLLADKADIDSVYNKSEVDIKLDEKADREYTYSKDEINGLLDEKANYETIQGIEGSINNIHDTLSNHQSQLDNKANADDVYTKQETNDLLNGKANANNVYTKSEAEKLLNQKADKSNTYTRLETINLLDGKANASDVYSKSETEELLNEKANVEDLSLKADIDSVYGREYIDSHLNEKANAYELDGKQDTLVNQQNIKSVQNKDILGEGNIELFSMLNQDEYDSLEEKDSNKLYLITDTHRVYYQDNLIIDGSATPTPEPTEETMVTFYYIDGTDGDYIEYTQLKGVAPYTITRQAVMDCLDEAIAKEGIARMVTKIELSDGVHRIDNEAFSGFTSLKEVQYGANLREMGSSAFTHCTSLTNLVIPDSVTGETDFTFTECSNATTCYVGTGITTLGGDTFCDCPKLTSCHIPSNVTNLGGEHGGVFARCYALTSVTIDGQIDYIGQNTFLDTNNLTELWLTGCTNVPSAVGNTFVLENPSNVTVHIPCNMTDAYQMTDAWSIFMDHYVEEGDCDEPTGTLCMTLSSDGTDTNIYQNDGETIKQALDRYLGDTFGYDDFDALHCNKFKSSITHVAFSNNITQIESTNIGLFGYGTDAGYGQYDGGWNNIVSVTLPTNLQTIGNNVFQIMPKVSQWNIPSTVTSIGNAAFERRSQDANVNRVIRFNRIQPPTLGNNVFDIVDEEEMMVSADTNQRIETPTNCEDEINEYHDYFLIEKGGTYAEYLNNGVFVADECNEPEPTEGKLVMTLYKGAPDAEDSVAYEVYQNDGETIKQAMARFLTDRFDDSTSMDNFKRSITNVVFDNSVTDISGVWLFGYGYGSADDIYDSGWRNISSVTLPNNLTTIGHDAFADMPKVERWDIPSTVTSIGYMAFQRDNKQQNVYRTIRFNSVQPPTLGNNVFDITSDSTYGADANQRIEAPIDCEVGEDVYSTYFTGLGKAYKTYVDLHILVVDECH